MKNSIKENVPTKRKTNTHNYLHPSEVSNYLNRL